MTVKNEYSELAKTAFKSLRPLSSTYLCETGISTMDVILKKPRKHLRYTLSPVIFVINNPTEINYNKPETSSFATLKI